MIRQVVFNGPKQMFCLDSLLCAFLNYVNGLSAPSPNPEPVRTAKAEPLIGSRRPPSTAGGYIPCFNMQRQHQGSSQNPYSHLTQNPSPPMKPTPVNRERPHHVPQPSVPLGNPGFTYSPYTPTLQCPPDDMMNMARYLACREIVSTGLKQFVQSHTELGSHHS